MAQNLSADKQRHFSLSLTTISWLLSPSVLSIMGRLLNKFPGPHTGITLEVAHIAIDHKNWESKTPGNSKMVVMMHLLAAQKMDREKNTILSDYKFYSVMQPNIGEVK